MSTIDNRLAEYRRLQSDSVTGWRDALEARWASEWGTGTQGCSRQLRTQRENSVLFEYMARAAAYEHLLDEAVRQLEQRGRGPTLAIKPANDQPLRDEIRRLRRRFTILKGGIDGVMSRTLARNLPGSMRSALLEWSQLCGDSVEGER